PGQPDANRGNHLQGHLPFFSFGLLPLRLGQSSRDFLIGTVVILDVFPDVRIDPAENCVPTVHERVKIGPERVYRCGGRCRGWLGRHLASRLSVQERCNGGVPQVDLQQSLIANDVLQMEDWMAEMRRRGYRPSGLVGYALWGLLRQGCEGLHALTPSG